MRTRLTLALLFLATTSFAQSAADLDTRQKKLNDLVTEVWEYRLTTSPELASSMGDRRYNDRLADRSFAALEKNAAKGQAFLVRAEAISTRGFAEQDAITRTILIQQLKNEREDFRLKSYEMPVNQFRGIHLDLAQMVALTPFANEKDYLDWIARMHQVPAVFDATIDLMRRGMRDGLMPPKILLEKAAAQMDTLGTSAPEESPFAEPLKKMPATIPAARQAELREALLAAIRTDVLPSYIRLAKFTRDDYAPHGRDEVGMWSLPLGTARYNAAVRRNTTTSMTPEEIHQLGMREVARDEADMLVIAKQLGFDSLAALNASIDANPELHAKSREQILDLFRTSIAAMDQKLPQLFHRLPQQRVEVRATEAFREKTAATQYQRGTRDGSRPGFVVVVTYKPEERKLNTMEATAYHEGVPGHHLQNAIAQEIPGLPPLRQSGGFVAFGEGWALYAERLGKEVGLYKDPYFDYGRLQSDIFRAVRLVVDTGMHAKGWSKQRAIDYMTDNSALSAANIEAEVNRYIADPGQALAYKLGELKIRELRARAEQALGAKFDLRRFHDAVLGQGAVPLDTLEAQIDAWIASERARG
jgi:uncharacterized protein (DUF885 family)